MPPLRRPLTLSAVALALTAMLIAPGCAKPAEKEARFLETGKRLLQRRDYQRALIEFRNASQAEFRSLMHPAAWRNRAPSLRPFVYQRRCFRKSRVPIFSP